MMMRSILTVLVALILLAISVLIARITLAAFGGGLVLIMFSDAPNSPVWPILLQFLAPLLLIAPVGLAWVLLFSRAPLSALALGIVGALGADCYLYIFKNYHGIFAFVFLR
jgi:hypothetical protein